MKQEYIDLIKELEDNNISADEVRHFLKLKNKLNKNKIIIKKFCNLGYYEEHTLDEFLKDIKYVLIASQCIEFRKNPDRLGLVFLHEWFGREPDGCFDELELKNYSKTVQKEEAGIFFNKKYITTKSFENISFDLFRELGIEFNYDDEIDYKIIDRFKK